MLWTRSQLRSKYLYGYLCGVYNKTYPLYSRLILKDRDELLVCYYRCESYGNVHVCCALWETGKIESHDLSNLRINAIPMILRRIMQFMRNIQFL